MANQLRKIARRWYCEKDFSILGFTVFVMHQISFCFSPLNARLVESSRRRVTLSSPQPASNVISYPVDFQVQDYATEDWKGLLLRPLELARLVKKYHCAGNFFLLSMVLQLVVIAYGTFKAIFYQFYVGGDEELIGKLRDSFPRLFESYPNPPDLYSTMTVSCSYCFLLRLMTVINLIKMSVINSKRYNEISMTQLNVTFFRDLSLPLKDWLDILVRGGQHKDICSRTTRRRGLELEAHLSYGPNMAKQLRTQHKSELMYYNNMIDFSECYKYFGYDIKRSRRARKAEDVDGWFIPESNCRMDICECSQLVFTTLFLIPFFLVLVIVIMVEVIVLELSLLTKDPNETYVESLTRLPSLLTDPGRLMRVFDIYGVFAIQLPHQWSVTAVFMDLLALNSRIKKVTESLQEICVYCADKAHEYDIMFSDVTSDAEAGARQDNDLFQEGFMEKHRFSYVPILAGSVDYGRFKSMRMKHYMQDKSSQGPPATNMSNTERSNLNYRIETLLGLVRLLDIEFNQLKRSSSAFINILFTGGGFCAVLSITSMFVATPGITLIILASMVISSVMPIIGVVPLCFGTERAVSMRIVADQVQLCTIINSLYQCLSSRSCARHSKGYLSTRDPT